MEEKKMKTGALLYKIAKIRSFSILAIISVIFSVIIIWSLNINIFFMGFCVYLFSLYVTCFFVTNEIVDKYKDKECDFYMSKETFISFFKKAYVLKIILMLILIITLALWLVITFNFVVMSLKFDFLTIFITLLMLLYFCYSTKKLIDSFVIIVFMTRIIDYVCKEK